MFRREKKIPTVLGVFLIALGIGATTYLVKNFSPFLTRANPNQKPEAIKITNLAESGLTVSWISREATSGFLKFGQTESELEQTVLDDRDQVARQLGQHFTHHVTFKYLKPQTNYYFKIISQEKTYDEEGKAFKVTTAPLIGNPPPTLEPVHGTVFKSDGTPAQGAIVYLTLPQVSPLSTLVKSGGNWLIPLSSARSQNLAQSLVSKPEGAWAIFVQGGEATAQAITDGKNASPVPKITLGKNFDFREGAPLTQETPTPSAQEEITPSPGLGFSSLTSPQVSTPSFSLLQPASEAALPGQPFFKGTGLPGKTVTIEIRSAQIYTGTVTIDKNGGWSWTPPTVLSPGTHTVTASSLDEKGVLQKISRRFTVLASGEQVQEPATPSATPKLSPTPLATTTPTPATVSPIPKTADLSFTFLFLTTGIFFVILGLVFLKPDFVKN